MKKKRFALFTGVVSALGLAAYLGHKRQVEQQETEEAILARVRSFFEPMGEIEVVYTTPSHSRAGATTGGVVFNDGVVFEFRYHKGEIDYRQSETLEDKHD